MGIEDQFSKIEFVNQFKEDEEVNKKIGSVVDSITRQGEQVNPFVLECFEDPDLFHSLPEEIKSNEQKLSELVLNMSKFHGIITSERQKRWSGDMSGLFGDEVYIAETVHANGKIRRAESDYKINVDYLRTREIDPSQILFFRITQPTDKPKPEYYWTSDYFETQRGLTREISSEQRETAVILVASLDVINNNEGLIQDINDDNGLAVRQIGTGNFDQTLALTKIFPYKRL